MGYRLHSERRRLRIESAPTAWVRALAAFAASPFIDSAGTRICGTPDQTRMRSGIVCALRPGNSGMRQIARQHSCVAFKDGAAAKQVEGYGKTLRLTIAFHFFVFGANIEICVGRSCSTFGACQTFKPSIATSTRQNAPSRRETDERHACSKLN